MTLNPDDGHAIGLDNNLMTNLSDLHQRMPFVLKAAAQFDKLLHDGNQYQAVLVVGRFEDNKRPEEERYLITLAMAKPWVRS